VEDLLAAYGRTFWAVLGKHTFGGGEAGDGGAQCCRHWRVPLTPVPGASRGSTALSVYIGIADPFAGAEAHRNPFAAGLNDPAFVARGSLPAALVSDLPVERVWTVYALNSADV
jgi:hypothetical protein